MWELAGGEDACCPHYWSAVNIYLPPQVLQNKNAINLLFFLCTSEQTYIFVRLSGDLPKIGMILAVESFKI